MVTAYMVNYLIKENKYNVSIGAQIGMIIGAFVGVFFTSLLIQACFITRTEDINGEYHYESNVQWFDVLIPMLLVCFTTIIWHSWKKNRELYKYWSRDHPIIDITQRRIDKHI